MKVLFLPQNKEILAKEGETLLEVCKRANIFLGETCNGRGTCKKCKVILDWEECLACEVKVEEDIEVIIPYEETGISDKKAKISQIRDNKIEKNLDVAVAKCGVAFDIGTTTVVGSLVNLGNGEILSIEVRQNPQKVAGADVISRIQYTEESRENLCFLQNIILDCCEEIIKKFQKNKKIEKIEKVTVVGNPTMSHIFLGYSPSSLARYPFLQQFCGIKKKIGKSLKDAILNCGDAHLSTKILEKIDSVEVTVLPNMRGQVGSDITMGILAADILKKRGNYIFIDIGTNAEMAFIQDGKCFVCSAAAGPVFEGASIEKGMRALDGAIESVKIDKNGKIRIKTIKNQPAIGICGSGIIEIIAELLNIGIIKKDGYMLSQKEAKAQGIAVVLCDRISDDGMENRVFYLINRDVFITQKDIREIQLAKGAIRTGMKTLLKEIKIEMEEIDEILVAGAFGSYLNTEAARRIGLFPNIPLEKIKIIGNTASMGAVQALLSDKVQEEALKLSREASFVELASHDEFYENFLTSLNFE